MTLAKDNPGTATPSRRYFRFSLRALMLFMLLCAILFGWVRFQIAQHETQ